MENNQNANGQLFKTRNEFEISDSALACIMFIVLNILFSIILTVSGLRVRISSFAYFVLHAVVEGLFAVGAFFVAKIKGKSLIKATGMNKKVNGSIVGWCFLIAFVSLLGFGNLTNVFLEILEYFGFSSAGSSIEINNFWQYLGYLTTSCLIAGFAEELLFRGVIESGLKKWGIKVAVGFSALIFMLMHGSALQTVHQLIIGIIIGYVYYKTNNLWIGVLIHFFNNFIPVTEVYLLTMIAKSSSNSEILAETSAESIGLGTILIDLVMALAVAWAGYYFVKLILKKIFKENEKLNGENKSSDVVSSIKVDGENKEVEMSIDGVPAVNESTESETNEKRPKISGGTIAMFSLAGLYLVVEWFINTISRFL